MTKQRPSANWGGSRPNSGRKPQITVAVDRAVNAVNQLLDLAEQAGIETTELQDAQASLDQWAIRHADHEIKQTPRPTRGAGKQDKDLGK